jgi:Thermolysin metallopeptidase, alpha-helical domain/Thermolysin metallopeptidase, catalytic domain
MNHSFIPPYLLRRIAETDPSVADRCSHTLEIDARLRGRRTPGAAPEATTAAAVAWTVHSADGSEELPGSPVRSAGEPASGDAAVDEAATGIEASLDLAAAYGRASYDGNGATVLATVHYGQRYANAFWDGTQLVFGDGDGRIFDRFTKPVDVLGHEFAHAVTQHTAGLVYQDQPGALNESVSDVFAACMKQRLLGQQAADADWLIGAELFLPGVSARALRDMAAPGTAYDDPVLGKDPQVGHLDDYVVTDDDNGGVHLNSGIPNRAFHLAATSIGGTSWEGAGRVWWTALTGGEVGQHTDFAAFAAATVAAAGDQAAAVEDAWAEVGVTPGASAPTGPERPADDAAEAVLVRRSGGFVGRTVEARRDLRPGDPVADEARQLVDRIDLTAARSGPPMPDMFVYTFELPGRPPVSVPQQHLTDDLRRLADLVLGDDPLTR